MKTSDSEKQSQPKQLQGFTGELKKSLYFYDTLRYMTERLSWPLRIENEPKKAGGWGSEAAISR